MKEAQTGGQVGDDGRGFVHGARESGGRPWLVMILHEVRELRLVVEPGVEMLPHRPGVTLAEPIVQSLVVGVVETLVLHGRFKVPIDLRHEAEARNALAHAPDRVRPEEWRTAAPGPFENLWQHQHGHVAAQAVTLLSDPQELSDHRRLCGRIAVVKLDGVRPAGEVRIASEGQHLVTPWPVDTRVVVRFAREIGRGPGHEVLRMIGHPGMIGCGMVRHKVEHQPQPAAAKPLADSCQRLVAA